MAPMFITVHIGISDSMVQVYWSNKKSKSSCHASCADPGIFVRGVQVNPKKTSSGNDFFLVLSLFYRSQMVNFKAIYHFSRFQRGTNIFKGGGGGVQLFPGGGPIAYSL